MKINLGNIKCERCDSFNLEQVSDGITNGIIMIDFVCNDCDLIFNKELPTDKDEYFKDSDFTVEFNTEVTTPNE